MVARTIRGRRAEPKEDGGNQVHDTAWGSRRGRRQSLRPYHGSRPECRKWCDGCDKRDIGRKSLNRARRRADRADDRARQPRGRVGEGQKQQRSGRGGRPRHRGDGHSHPTGMGRDQSTFGGRDLQAPACQASGDPEGERGNPQAGRPDGTGSVHPAGGASGAVPDV